MTNDERVRQPDTAGIHPEVLYEIRLKRKALEWMAAELGLTHPAVVAFSQELDELILLAQKQKKSSC